MKHKSFKLDSHLTIGKKTVLDRAYQDYNSNIVSIDNDAITALDFSNMKNFSLGTNEINALKDKNFEESVAFLIALNSINYRYWDLLNKKFYRYQHQNQVGAIAAFTGFEKLWIDYRANDMHHDLSYYFGNIPAMASRQKILSESLNPYLQGRVYQAIMDDIDTGFISSYTAQKIAQIMPKSFQEPYLKKIQLALYEIALNSKQHGFLIKEQLTVAADYQLPKVLEAKGILLYSQELKDKIENYQPIDNNSVEENSLRAATILACEKIHQVHKVSIPLIDRWLWLARNDYKDKKFHLTFTTAY